MGNSTGSLFIERANGGDVSHKPSATIVYRLPQAGEGEVVAGEGCKLREREGWLERGGRWTERPPAMLPMVGVVEGSGGL